MNVRFAQERDVNWIIPQLREFAEDSWSGEMVFPKSLSDARRHVLWLIEDHLFLVAETDCGEGVGFVVGLMGPHSLNLNVLMCMEVLWWVKREYRATKAPIMLMDEYTRWCRENVDMGIFSAFVGDETLPKRLEARGWRAVETRYFLSEVSDGR